MLTIIFRPNILKSEIRCLLYSLLYSYWEVTSPLPFFFFPLTFLSQNFWVSFWTILNKCWMEIGLIQTIFRSLLWWYDLFSLLVTKQKFPFTFLFSYFPDSVSLSSPVRSPMILIISVHQLQKEGWDILSPILREQKSQGQLGSFQLTLQITFVRCALQCSLLCCQTE